MASPSDIARQYAAIRAAARWDGFLIPAAPGFAWEDDGWSGGSLDRPAFRALVALIEVGDAPFTRLYVADETRLFRPLHPRQRADLELRFEDRGVSIRYANHFGRQGVGDGAASAIIPQCFVEFSVDGRGGRGPYRRSRRRSQ